MNPRANGYFEAFANSVASTPTAEDRALVSEMTRIAREVVPGSQIHWAGSQRKGTAIQGSDLDLCLESNAPVTEAQRRDLRRALEANLRRPALVLSHVIRLPKQGSRPKADLAFANAAFGSRPLPDRAQFHDHRARQAVARSLKACFRAGGLPAVPGWVIEALVVHLSSGAPDASAVELLLRVLAWLDERATPAAIEGVLRPFAFPRWRAEWSARVPGDLEALRNHARHVRRREPQPDAWRSAADVGRWLAGENFGRANPHPGGEG